MGVIFNPNPYDLNTLEIKDIIPLNPNAFNDYAKQKSLLI